MQWHPSILNDEFAPKLGELTKCSAPEVEELPNHLGSLHLNQIFGQQKYAANKKILIAIFIGRLGHSILEYRVGRRAPSTLRR